MVVGDTPSFILKNTDENQSYYVIKNRAALIDLHKFKSVIDSLNAFELTFCKTSPYTLIKNKIKYADHLISVSDIYNNIRTFHLDNSGSLFVISVGKASVKMLTSIFDIFQDRIEKSILIMPKGFSIERSDEYCLNKNKTIIIESSHPIPDINSLTAGEKVIELLLSTKKNDVIIFLISGGTSSLLVSPIENLTLDDKRKITSFLVTCGANIVEINTVRKHLSKIKGGNMLKYMSNDACVISLIISDVIGDNIDTIGSGLTYFDNSTFLDAKIVLQKYSLLNKQDETMKKVYKLINLGIDSKLPETLKSIEYSQMNVNNFIMGNNNTFCNTLIKYFDLKGYDVDYLGSNCNKQISVFVNDCKTIFKKLRKKNCIIMGGEITNIVDKNNNGVGGRNQEALSLLIDYIHNCNIDYDDYSIIFLGTDGIDGNSLMAGGLVSPKTLDILKRNEIDIEKYINSYDSSNLFHRLKSCIMTGYTGTNVNDIYLFVRN
ncbi:MAG TPA: DUF4147 domain-containing protein [Verrucomicrobiae bacterium]|nr:DUF4147 domain-containing protein [Verrucomicrobiae bacterium]